ncbi:MAG: ABC transporter transmembrane domain-containing protein [Roseburia sp.]|nr:ABC transporter transmembrane domain-containing protein [Roseburia sp.]
MILKYELSEENRKLLELSAKEEIYYCLPLDIDFEGNYQDDSYTVMTDRRIVVLERGRVAFDYRIADCDAIKSEPQIACGIVYLVKDGQEILLGRFSAKHLTRYSYLFRGMQILKKGRRERVISSEYEHSCPKCGRALPGTKECPRCSGKKEGLIYTFVEMLRPHKARLAVIFLLMLGATFVTLAAPEIQKYLVDDVLVRREKDYGLAAVCLLLMLAVTVGIVFINAAKSYLCSKLGSCISEDQRGKLFQKLQMLSLSFINDRSAGELMNRILQDTDRIKNFFGEVFCNLFTVGILFVCVVLYMLVLNWRLALLAFLFTPVSVGVSMGSRRRIRKRFRLQGAKSDKVNNNLQDVISGMAVVKSYGQEKRESLHFDETTEELARIQKSNEVFFAVFYPMVSFMLGSGIYLVTFVGGSRVLGGSMTPGELLQFISYTSLLYNYVNWISGMPRALMNLVTSLERIGDVLNQEPSIADLPDAVEHEIEGEITFRNASFGYKSYQPVLEGIHLTVHKGEMIGLVGASGTGKSTMINLIMHLYEVDDGEILVDNIDIRKIKLENYHRQLGVVLQENFLFAGTIYNNIRFARPDAGYEEVIRVAKMANAHDFICRLPDGYNTYVGEHGYNLSGGERQRIAIARAMLGNPRLLILDEATASLDTESEYLIQRALGRLTKGRTTFAIAHRLSTLKDADRLVVIDGHRIAEAGTHEELLAKKGIYYGLVQAQLQGKL